MKLSEVIRIDNRFEKSVNLLLDLHNPAKLRLYIPTRSSSMILEDYLLNTIEAGRPRATMLIGPYGKGKSHLLLVLLAILSGEFREETADLVKRIENVNGAFGAVAEKVENVCGKFLPVIINPGQGSLSDVFIKNLIQALKRDGLEDIAPSSYYTEAVKAIENWRENYPTVYEMFTRMPQIHEHGVDDFITDLAGMHSASLKTFRDLYPELTAGSTFNPVIEDSVIDVYRSVNRSLCERYSYSGIYIIFDEFSKYVEGHLLDGFASDMKTLQDICELANASGDEQLHITCVAHKAISSYKGSLPKEILNAYRGVEGRITEKQFIVSSQNNYELIADALIKSEAFAGWADNSDSFSAVSNENYRLPVFHTLFTEDDFNSIVAKGCYPLSPLTAMLLLSLSEKVAQNERTVFTFLTENNENGLEAFIKNGQGMEFANADIVYDYFYPIFRDNAGEHIHQEWLKAEYALSKCEREEEQKYIKSLSIIKMVGRDELPATDKILKIASGLDQNEAENTLASLIDKGLFVFRARTGAYEFRNVVSVDVEKAISDCVATRFANADVAEILNTFNLQKYILPKRHNQTFSMTRYFNCFIMRAESFLALKSYDYMEWNNRPDGVVIMILPDEENKIDQVAEHVKVLGDPRVILCVPGNTEDISRKAKTISAVDYLKNDPSFIEDNQVVQTELDNMKEDLIKELNQWIEATYFRTESVYTNLGEEAVGRFGINRVVSTACDRAYPQSPRINNELINRHVVSSQTNKARNAIITDILNGGKAEKYEAATGPEATIGRAVLMRAHEDPGVQLALKEIEDFILSCDNKKVSFKLLMDKLMAPPYGMRAGVIPIYIAEVLSNMSSMDMPVIYFLNKEMPVTADTLGKMMTRTADYYLYVEKETAEKAAYLNAMESVFSDYMNSCHGIDARSRLTRLACTIQIWYRSLPQAAKTISNDIGSIKAKRIIAFRKLFAGIDINPREVIFEGIPKALAVDDFSIIVKMVQQIKEELNRYVSKLKREAETIIRKNLAIPVKNDFIAGLKEWYGTRPAIVKNAVFPGVTGEFLTALKQLESGESSEVANRLSRILTGMYAEDWIGGVPAELEKALEEIKDEIEERASKPEDTDQSISFMTNDGSEKKIVYRYDATEISPVGTFFKNALSEMMDEYGDSIDANEKIGILMDAVKQLMG